MRQDQSFAASRLPRPKELPKIGITTFIAGRNHSPKPSTLHAARLAAVEAAHGRPLLESPSRALRSLKSLVLNSPPMRRFSASMPASPHGSRSFAGSGISRLRSCGSRADSSQLPSPFRLARVKASQRAKSARQGFSQTTPTAPVPEQGEEPEGEGQEGEERQQMSETAPPPMPAERPPMPTPMPPPSMPPAPMAMDPAASRQPPPRVLEPSAPRQRPRRDTALPAPPRRPRSRELEPLQGRGAEALGRGAEAYGRGAEVAPRPDTWRVRSNGDLPRPPPRPPAETRRACSADGARGACPRTAPVRAAKTGPAAASAPSAPSAAASAPSAAASAPSAAAGAAGATASTSVGAGAPSATAAAPSTGAARERRRSNPSVIAAKQPPAPPDPPDPPDPFSELRSSGQSVLELLRVEAGPSEWVETSEAEIAAGLALLGEVRAAADGLGCAQGALWQALLYEQSGSGRGGGGGSGPVVQRTPLKRAGRSFSLDGTELLGFVGLEPLGLQRRHALGAGAARLRGLLRLSLMDDNDLQLAQRALREATAFFEALRAAAAHAGSTPHALWASLKQPANTRG